MSDSNKNIKLSYYDENNLIDLFKNTIQIICKNNRLRNFTKNSMAKSVLYDENYVFNYIKEDGNIDILIDEDSTLNVAKKYIKHGKVTVLNFANPIYPGGGVKYGAIAQEESLCRSTNLYPCISQVEFYNGFYLYHKKLHNALYSNKIIFSPDIVILKSDEIVPSYLEENKWVKIDVITCSAPYYPKCYNISELTLSKVFIERITRIIEVANYNNAKVLILGAFGCGAFSNPPHIVAKAFSDAIKIIKPQQKIVFAITSSKYNDDNNLEIFKKHLELK